MTKKPDLLSQFVKKNNRPLTAIGLAGVAGFALTLAGWHPLALSGDYGAAFVVGNLGDGVAGVADLAWNSAIGFAALAAAIVIGRRSSPQQR